MKKIAVIAALMFLLAGCSSISKNDAEQRAADFVKQNVKFFAREQNSSVVGFQQYSIDSLSSYKESGNWVVAMHVTASLGNETKKNDMIVKLDGSGNIVEFNGKGVKK